MTVREYLDFVSRIKGVASSERRERVSWAMERTHVADMADRHCAKLSKGYRQRVGLAQALIHDPPILILDEPTSDLDPNEKAEFLNYLKQIGKDRTVLLSTHNLKEVESACARAIIVSRGRVVADGALDEIRAKSGRVRYIVSVQESVGTSPYRGSGPLPKQSEVELALGRLPGVKKVAELPTDDRAHAYAIDGEDNQDIRADIFRLIADKGWVLLELHRDTQTLEDVFRQLTIGDERRNRQIGPVTETRGGSDDEEEDDEDDDEDEEEDDDEEESAPVEAKRGKR
jgi:ABC-2 type transport system ATP-binding protein